MLPVELILLYMVYLGMGPGAYKISKPLDAGFILFQFWVGLISVVPVCAEMFDCNDYNGSAEKLWYPLFIIHHSYIATVHRIELGNFQ